MKLTTQNKVILGVSALAVTGIVIAGLKAKKVKEIFDLMEIEPDRASNIKLDIYKMTFNLDVKLTNKSEDDLFVSGAGMAALKSIRVFYDGTYIATALVNMDEIEIGGKETLIVKNIPIAVDWSTVLSSIKALTNFNLDKIGIIGIVEALGKTYEIGKA